MADKPEANSPIVTGQTAVKDIGKEVSSVDGLYDMQGLAGALRSQ